MQLTNLGEIWASIRYLGIFIAVLVAFLYLISRSGKVSTFIYKQRYSLKEKLGMTLFFGFLGVLASEYGLKLIGVVVNARDFIAVAAGILGGPAVGIGAGLISGIYRMTPPLVEWITGNSYTGWTGTLGYWSAIGCGLATIGAGFVGTWLSKYKKINIRTITSKQIWWISGVLIIWQVIHLQVINPIIAPLYTDKTFMWVQKMFFTKLLLPMALINALGIFLFLFIVHDLVKRKEMDAALKEIEEAEKQVEKL